MENPALSLHLTGIPGAVDAGRDRKSTSAAIVPTFIPNWLYVPVWRRVK